MFIRWEIAHALYVTISGEACQVKALWVSPLQNQERFILEGIDVEQEQQLLHYSILPCEDMSFQTSQVLRREWDIIEVWEEKDKFLLPPQSQFEDFLRKQENNCILPVPLRKLGEEDLTALIRDLETALAEVKAANAAQRQDLEKLADLIAMTYQLVPPQGNISYPFQTNA